SVRATLEAPAVVAGLDDVAVVGQAIEQRGRHLGIAEDARPFPEGEVRGDEERGAFVEPADEVEEQLATGLGERQIAEFVEGDEAPGGEVMDERRIDRRAREVEVGEVLGERQLGDGELVFDRPRLLLADLGAEQIADDALGLMLALDGRGQDLVEGGLHAVELELTHEVEELGAFHQMVLRRVSYRAQSAWSGW